MLYNVNMDAICDMLEGQLLLQPAMQLASVLAITHIGSKKLLKSWLKSTFWVHCQIVYKALVWLKENNAIYEDIVISQDHLELLPEDDVLMEVLGVIQHEEDEDVEIREWSGYVPTEEINNVGELKIFLMFESPNWITR